MEQNKGAMFGLDARIALAIFAALSVIGGAALFSAAQDAKAQKYIRYLAETVKAHEAYLFDTGVTMPRDTSSDYDIFIPNLISNYGSIDGWNGPYLDNYRRVDNRKISFILEGPWGQLFQEANILKASEWSGGGNFWTDECTVGDKDCRIWHSLVGAPGNSYSEVEKIFPLMDKIVDNSDGKAKGKIRYRDNGYAMIFYPGMPYIRKI